MKILAIETSCDETSVAVATAPREVAVNLVYSQLEHARFGGIVPEVASRQQLKKLWPLYDQALSQVDVGLNDMDGIGVTVGPGLVGSLLVGVNFAKGLAYATGLPLVGINHLEGHIFSNFLEHPNLVPPLVTLIVSGGHTLLVHVEEYLKYRILGQTRDDAGGEAYDKVAKLLGLGYPGGARIDALASRGNPNFIKFPRAYLEEGSFDFSFSGVKTAVALYVREQTPEFVHENLADICASFQESVIEVLVEKAVRAARTTRTKHLAVAGGVAANSRLRERLARRCEQFGLACYFPSPLLCGDNAAMIAAAAYRRLERGLADDLSLNAYPNLPLV